MYEFLDKHQNVFLLVLLVAVISFLVVVQPWVKTEAETPQKPVELHAAVKGTIHGAQEPAQTRPERGRY